jgi:tetratricopeptide (TPR) repeat protein
MLFWTHDSLAKLFRDQDEFDEAHAHIKQAKEHAVDNKYLLGRAMDEHALIWYRQGRHEEAVSEVMCAIEIFGKLGAAVDLERCRNFIRDVEQSMKKP